MNQRKIIFLSVIIISVGTLGLLSASFLKHDEPRHVREDTKAHQAPEVAGEVFRTETPRDNNDYFGWNTYHNEEYRFSFMYPTKAVVQVHPGRTPLLSHISIEFSAESSFYNRAALSFFVYAKGAYQHPSKSGTCEIYRRYTQTYDGVGADIIEQADCPDSEGSPSAGSGHSITAIMNLSDKEDLVFTVNLNNSFIEENELASKILATLKFIR